jgi:hypothetical protein
MSKNPLTNEQLKQVAPSIFSEAPIEGVSDKYAFVPTYSILDTFRDAGYYPIMASESKVRNDNNQGYQNISYSLEILIIYFVQMQMKNMQI